MGKGYFNFKRFVIFQNDKVFKLSTDSVLLGSIIPNSLQPPCILDIGAGTGIITLMMAQKFNSAFIDAIEKDVTSCQYLKKNISLSQWQNRITPYCMSIQYYANKTITRYQLIVSNPPFFNTDILPNTEEKKQFKHTVTLSYEELFNAANKLSTTNGIFYATFPYNVLDEIIYIATQHNWHSFFIQKIKWTPNKDFERVICGFNKNSLLPLQIDELCIYNQNGRYSSAYKNITKDFYLDKFWENH